MSDAIIIKSPREIELMRQAGRITAQARSIARQAVADGITTKQIDKLVNEFIRKSGAKPTFLGYGGFPASTCLSVNEEVIHGIPGKRVVHNGDIVSVDVGATYRGFVGDCAGTYACGEKSASSRSRDSAFSRGSSSRRQATASPTSGARYRTTRRATATRSCANMWDTASAASCTKLPRSPTTARTNAFPTGMTRVSKRA